jgi:FkbM family methyltransferase
VRRVVVPLAAAARQARAHGLGRFVDGSRDAIDRLFLSLDRPPLSIGHDGLSIHGYLRHRSFLAGLEEGSRDSYAQHLFATSVRPDATVIDGGAHVGLYTLIAARGLAGSGMVIAFEPDPYNVRALKFNTVKNGFDNVVVVEKALGARRGRTEFYRSKGTIGSSIFPRRGIGPLDVLPLELTTVDHELRGYALRSIIVKLDVEGAEVVALNGMRATIERCESVDLFAEVNPDALEQGSTTSEELIRTLQDLRFSVFVIDEAGRALVRVSDDVDVPKCNLFCRKG